MVKKIILIFIILLFCCFPVYAQYEHTFFTGEQIICKWDPATVALGYEWVIQRKSDSFAILEGQTELCEITNSITSAGIYVLYVRAWNFAEDGETIYYSDWATSLTYGVVDEVTQSWQIKINLKSVGPLMFDFGD